MTIDELRARLRRARMEIARARVGDAGRFSVTLYQPRRGECSILHWFRPDGAGFEQCREIGHGSISECVAALDRYVAAAGKPAG